MSEIQLAHFSWGETPGSRIHAVAVHEARVASEYRRSPAPETTGRGLRERLGLTRVRVAFAGGAGLSTDPCNCPA